MNDKDKIEMVRRILNNAVNINMKQNIVLQISQKLDQHIIDYYLNNDEMRGKEKSFIKKQVQQK
ncbi:MAG: Spo0E family sporulation regulatory protein-aspartic acid phosphatase [Syntrophomonadaceae bacterium]|nr:Spo0E family sporulation regulatory protein-aspartic acid phosphatase [Syntrophomonadaceae bacterium]